MKKIPALLAVVALSGFTASLPVFADDTKAPAAAKAAAPAAKPAASAAPAFQTEDQKVAYIIGLNIANNLNQMRQQTGFAADPSIVMMGIKDAISGADLKISKEEMATTMQSFQQKMQAKQKEMQAAHDAEMKKIADKNAADGKAYLEANAKKEGVVTTKSGLQYKIITKGKGEKPKATDSVTVNYRGTLIDGKEFDSSYKRNEPATFGVDQVIPGWTEALQLMPVGSKWEITIPSELGYGPGGTGSDIGPNATLVFEVELLKIVPPGNNDTKPEVKPDADKK